MEIGDSAFNKCASLTHIYVPNTVKVIGNSTFDDCPKLTIYCALPTKLSGWHENWNSSATVIWNSYLGIFGDINGFEYVACVDEEGNKYIVHTQKFQQLRQKRSENLEDLKEAYAHFLEEYALKYPYQFYHFHDITE